MFRVPSLKTIEKARWVRDGQVPDRDASRKFACPIQNADPEVRLSVMDKYGVNVQAVSLTIQEHSGWV